MPKDSYLGYQQETFVFSMVKDAGANGKMA
jgi:hypothetical protein